MLQIKYSYAELVESKKVCLEHAFKHVAGMFCYWCDPNWEQWLTQESDGSFQLQLNNQVCQSLSGQCFGYLESMQKQYETAVEVQKLNNFLDHDDQIRAYVKDLDYGSLENLYAQH